jgi:ketosteroid isomerase-like protein
MQAEDAPDEESWGTVTHITDAGKPVLDMQAAYTARFEAEEPTDSTYMVLSGLDSLSDRVRVDLYDEDGDSSAVVFADQLTYYEREKQFVARGNVVVTTRDGEHVEAEHLAWSESLKKIWTPGFARFREGEDIWEGYNFEATDDLKEKHLENVTGVFHPDEE